jgi:hypothetical protein
LLTIPARARLTYRLREAAGAAGADAGRTVVQPARDHGASWPVVMAAFTVHAQRVLPARPDAVRVLGIDEIRRGKAWWVFDEALGTWRTAVERWQAGGAEPSGFACTAQPSAVPRVGGVNVDGDGLAAHEVLPGSAGDGAGVGAFPSRIRARDLQGGAELASGDSGGKHQRDRLGIAFAARNHHDDHYQYEHGDRQAYLSADGQDHAPHRTMRRRKGGGGTHHDLLLGLRENRPRVPARSRLTFRKAPARHG